MDTCSIQLNTCTVQGEFDSLGHSDGLCIDNQLVGKITGYLYRSGKDKIQRDICRCAKKLTSVLMKLSEWLYLLLCHQGNYNTVKYNLNKHDQNSPILVGELPKDDIRERAFG